MPVGKAGELRAFASVGRYLQGPGAIAWLPQMTQRLGKSAAMLMGTHFYNREIDRIRGLFTEVKMEVTLHKISGSCTALEVEALKRMIAELPSQPDVIIGLGGGKTLDTVRIVAAQLDKAMLLIPTSVATNAATSGLSVMYDEVHRAKTVYLRRNPDCILVDTEFVIQGSPRMLAAGIGDSLATYFEARNNWLANNINTVMPGYRQTLCGKSIAEACVETLLKNGESAYCAVQHGLRTEEFEDTVEAINLLSGLGWENNGCSITHALTPALAAAEQTHTLIHGECVAFCLLVQLLLDRETPEMFARVRSLCRTLHLPVNLYGLGITGGDREKAVRCIVEYAFALQDTLEVTNYPVTPEKLYNAIFYLDALSDGDALPDQ